MRVFYPVFQVTELAAGYRYKTRLLIATHCQRGRSAYPDELPLVLVAAQCRPVL